MNTLSIFTLLSFVHPNYWTSCFVLFLLSILSILIFFLSFFLLLTLFISEWILICIPFSSLPPFFCLFPSSYILVVFPCFFAYCFLPFFRLSLLLFIVIYRYFCFSRLRRSCSSQDGDGGEANGLWHAKHLESVRHQQQLQVRPTDFISYKMGCAIWRYNWCHETILNLVWC